MKTIKMFTTAAGPDRILHAGETYSLPNDVAESLLAGRAVHGQTSDGKPVLGGPCAVEVKGRGLVPGRPDPDEHRSDEFVDEDEDEDEE